MSLSDHGSRRQALFRLHPHHKRRIAIISDRPPVPLSGLSISYLDDIHALASRGTFLILLDRMHGRKIAPLHQLLYWSLPYCNR